MTAFRERLKLWIKWYLANAKLVARAGVALVFIVIVAATMRWWSSQSNPSSTPSPVPASQPAVVSELPTTVEYQLTDAGLVPTGLPVTYVVQPGDSTWKIAEAFFGHGENYVDIEQANGLAPDQMLEVGQELLVPAVPVRQEVQLIPAEGVETTVIPAVDSESTQYTVQKGDCLWCIAEMKLQQGTRWTEIYQLNLQVVGDNPDLIFPGQVLQLPN